MTRRIERATHARPAAPRGVVEALAALASGDLRCSTCGAGAVRASRIGSDVRGTCGTETCRTNKRINAQLAALRADRTR